MAKTSPGPKVRFVDNPEAPEIFADAAKGVFLLNGNVHLTFTSRRSDYSNDQPGALNGHKIGREHAAACRHVVNSALASDGTVITAAAPTATSPARPGPADLPGQRSAAAVLGLRGDQHRTLGRYAPDPIA
jgi:hypothetical protein